MSEKPEDKFDADKEIAEIFKINKDKPKEADIVLVGNLSDEGLAEILAKEKVSQEEKDKIFAIAKKVKEESVVQKEIDSLLNSFEKDEDADINSLSEELLINLGLIKDNKQLIQENKIKLEKTIKDIGNIVSSKKSEQQNEEQRELFDRFEALTTVWRQIFVDEKPQNKESLE